MYAQQCSAVLCNNAQYDAVRSGTVKDTGASASGSLHRISKKSSERQNEVELSKADHSGEE